MTVLEFWPDYGSGPLWSDAGEPVDPAELEMPTPLTAALTAWNAAYSEDKLPIDGPGDERFLVEGRSLLSDVRRALCDRYRVVADEPWWDEPTD